MLPLAVVYKGHQVLAQTEAGPPPSCTPEAEREAGWEMAHCRFDLLLTQEGPCALGPLKAQPTVLFGFSAHLKPRAGY